MLRLMPDEMQRLRSRWQRVFALGLPLHGLEAIPSDTFPSTQGMLPFLEVRLLRNHLVAHTALGHTALPVRGRRSLP